MLFRSAAEKRAAESNNTTTGTDTTTTSIVATNTELETYLNLVGTIATQTRATRTMDQVVDIEEEDTALVEEPVVETIEELEEETVTIEDDNTALAPTIEVEEAINWWWLLLVIAILGIAAGTGRYIYLRKEQEESAE